MTAKKLKIPEFITNIRKIEAKDRRAKKAKRAAGVEKPWAEIIADIKSDVKRLVQSPWTVATIAYSGWLFTAKKPQYQGRIEDYRPSPSPVAEKPVRTREVVAMEMAEINAAHLDASGTVLWSTNEDQKRMVALTIEFLSLMVNGPTVLSLAGIDRDIAASVVAHDHEGTQSFIYKDVRRLLTERRALLAKESGK